MQLLSIWHFQGNQRMNASMEAMKHIQVDSETSSLALLELSKEAENMEEYLIGTKSWIKQSISLNTW